MLMLDEDESFSLSGYVETPGEVRMALQGYLVSRRSDGTYIAPLIPQLFYGWNGSQLQTWRQNITVVGEQVILSRSGGLPKVPREELAWRKVAEPKVTQAAVQATTIQEPDWRPIIILGGIFLLLVLGKR
jgi:hypothetical protein